MSGGGSEQGIAAERAGGDFDHRPTLQGDALRVRPIAPGDFNALFAVAGDPLVWAQHPARERYRREVFERWFADALARPALVVEARASGEVIGSSSYYDWDPALREVAIGFTFLGRAHWGGPVNAELKRLMLAHAFRQARRVWFHVDPTNTRSRRAMAKIGGVEAFTAERSILGAPHTAYVFFRIDAPGTSSASAPATPST